ncbi:HNH endonuclease [Rhodococcus aetherivorans]
MTKAVGGAAWLAQSKQSDYRRLVGSDKYDDDPASRYSWDDSVVHYGEVRAGDIIAIWDESLIGVSVIEGIETGAGVKTISKCPDCDRSNVVSRKRKTPTYRCDDCRAEFEEPVIREKAVTTYRSSHSQSWVPLEGVLEGQTLRSLCVHPREQNSFRRLRWEDFRRAVEQAVDGDPLRILDVTSEQLAGGHVVRPVRVRVGQAAFRAKLLAEYGSRCAFTGPCPTTVLEACHLYSYAEVGEHRDQGGLLLRRDVHRLFDEGLLAVDDRGVIDVVEEVRDFPTYGELHGNSIKVELRPKQRTWLGLHWREWRAV